MHVTNTRNPEKKEVQQVKVKQAMAQKISAKQIVNLQSPSLIPYIAHTQHIKLVPENPMFPSSTQCATQLKIFMFVLRVYLQFLL